MEQLIKDHQAKPKARLGDAERLAFHKHGDDFYKIDSNSSTYEGATKSYYKHPYFPFLDPIIHIPFKEKGASFICSLDMDVRASA